jgi:hypothetical protein
MLRFAGAVLLALSYVAAMALRARALGGPITGDPLAYLLAAVSFMLGSGGAALLVLGRHLFDHVEVARRWSRYRR